MCPRSFRTALGVLVVLSTSLSAQTLPPQPPPPGADLAREVETEIRSIWEGLNGKRTAVRLTLDHAIAAGLFKDKKRGDWGAAFKDGFQADGAFPNPKTDPLLGEELGPEGEALRLAWAAYAREMERARQRGRELANLLSARAGQMLSKAAAEAKAPGELDPADKVLAAWASLRSEPRASSASDLERRAYQRVSLTIRNTLAGSEKNDLRAMSDAILAFDDNARISGKSDFANSPAAVRAAFFQRIYQQARPAVVEAQRELEKVIIAEAATEDLNAAFDDYRFKIRLVDQINNALNRRESFDLSKFYHEISDVALSVRSGRVDRTQVPSYPTHTMASPPTDEFKAYYAGLQSRYSKKRMEEHNRDEAARSAQTSRTTEALQSSREDRIKNVVTEFRKKIAPITAPEAALAVADELEPFERNRDFSGSLKGVKGELREVAMYWREGVAQSAPEMELNIAPGDHLLVEEIGAVRERAIRDVLSRRLNLPQLGAPPLIEKRVFDALRIIYEELAKKSDWRGALPVLRVLAAREIPRGGEMTDRLSAVNAYLTGENLELAARFRDAIDSYLVCVRSTADLLPIKEAGDRIKAIQAAHPDTAQPAAEQK